MTKYSKYSKSVNYERKLITVMDRLGAQQYNYDWSRNGCYVEMVYHGRAYRFENNLQQAAQRGTNCVSDMFAEIVLTLEDLARATERGILSLDMLLVGVPSLPAAVPEYLVLLGLDAQPHDRSIIDAAYRARAKQLHPDAGGDADKFAALQDAYQTALGAI